MLSIMPCSEPCCDGRDINLPASTPAVPAGTMLGTVSEYGSGGFDNAPARLGRSLPPIGFPGRPERWWRDEALQAEAEAAQASGEQRHHAARDIPALRTRSLFSTGVRFSTASHIPADPARGTAGAATSGSRSSRSVRVIWLSSRLKPRVLKSENMA